MILTAEGWSFSTLGPFSGERMNILHRFLRDDAGASALEYGLIAGLISVTIIVSAVAIGGGVESRFEHVQTSVN